jgi:hypothetical protein
MQCVVRRCAAFDSGNKGGESSRRRGHGEILTHRTQKDTKTTRIHEIPPSPGTGLLPLVLKHHPERLQQRSLGRLELGVRVVEVDDELQLARLGVGQVDLEGQELERRRRRPGAQLNGPNLVDDRASDASLCSTLR